MKKLATLFLGCTLLSTPAFSGGFKIALQGQKQTGMGSIGIGFAQDAATIYFNPAGMSFISDQVNVGFTALIPNTSFLERGTNTVYNSEKQVFTPFSFYGSYHLTKKLAVGLGVYTPFGSGVKYPTDWSGRYVLQQISLQSIFFQPSVSYQVGDILSFGAGFIYAIGNVLLEKDLPLSSGQDHVIANAQLKGKGSGIGMNASAYLKPSDRLSLGVTYHSRVNMNVKDGDATFTNIPSALATSFPATNKFSTELALPSEIGVGFSYKITKELTVAVDFNHTFWRSFDSLGFDYDVNSASLTDAKSPRLYENASCVRFGAQYSAGKYVDIRAGVFFDQTPVKDGYVAPELPDNNKVGLSVGGTFKIVPRLHVDLSLLYENVGYRTQRNIETGLDGSFQTMVLAPGIGINYLLHKVTPKTPTPTKEQE